MINNTSDLTYELGQNFIEYAAAVNSDRSIPDAKSGLKPVARRIIYGTFDSGFSSAKPHVKCAKIVGQVMGVLHPHGDSSIYGALVRLTQPWVMRYPLLDFHGNQGSIDGDGPAASRYTEARLAKLTEDGMLFGIKKKNVPFIPNYDETEEEPITLPALFPNLLCNPNSGIGVALACSWASHNLKEVAEAIYAVLDGNEPILPGPDFPTGGEIINKDSIPSIMKTGRGTVKIRARYNVEKNNLIFYEIPYGKNLEDIITEIGELCDKKEIEGISAIRNESNKKGLRLVVECEKGINPDAIARLLFSKSNLQSSFSYNQVALVDKTPTELNLKDCIDIYIKHNLECIVKEKNYDLEKDKARREIIEGLLKALEDIDNIIQLIKTSESAAAAKINLINKYKFTENQAKAILDMKLAKLAKLESVELDKEKAELDDSIAEELKILGSTEEQKLVLRNRLKDLVKKYGDDRRTILSQIDEPKTVKEKEIAEVVPEDCVVIMMQNGDIKRIPTKSFRTQKRNGKGIKNEDDAILDTISTNTIDELMFFTDKGKMYKLLANKIPEGTNASKGTKIANLIKIDLNEKVIAITSLHRNTNAKFIIFITKQGLIKKSKLEEYTNIKKSVGIQAIKLKDDDSIANITFVADENMILITKLGMGIKFTTTDITAIGRIAAGVKGIKLSSNDEVLIGLPYDTKKNDSIALITTKGIGKILDTDELPIQLRGGKGVICHKDELAGAAMVDINDSLLLIGRPNNICIAASDIPQLSRTGLGNILIKNSTINKVVKL